MSGDRSEYIETDSGSKISRKATICGSSSIVLGGKDIVRASVILRGDLRRSASGGSSSTVIAIGKYCVLGEGCVVRPAYRAYKG